MKTVPFRFSQDFAQVGRFNDRLDAVRRGAHMKAARRGVTATRAMWMGLAVSGFSTVILGLYSIYRLLSGVFIGAEAPSVTGLAFGFLLAIAVGVGISLAAFLTLLLQGRRDRAQQTAKTETTIAA